MEARVWRVRMAASAVPSVTAGSSSPTTPLASSPGSGSQRSSTAKARISSGPSQMLGMASPSTATVEQSASTPVPRRAAASTPSGSAMPNASASAASDRATVAGSTSAMSDPTVRAGLRNECPSEPSSTSPTKCPY
jgi:hypothetical protein